MVYLAVLLAAVAAMLVWALRYSPILFGNIWMKEMWMKMKDMENMEGVWKYYLGHFILNLIQLCVISYAITYLGVDAYDQLVYMAIVAWFALYAVPMAGWMIWEGKSFTLFALNSLHQLVALLVSVIVLFAVMGL